MRVVQKAAHRRVTHVYAVRIRMMARLPMPVTCSPLLLSWPLDPKEHSCKQDLCTSPQGFTGLWRRCPTFLTLLPSLLPLLLKPHQVVSNKSKPVMAGRGGWAWPWTHGMRVYSMNTVVQDTHTC